MISDKTKQNKKVINIETKAYRQFSDFVHDNYDKIFRYWIYRRGFTPYEQNEMFADDSMFEDSYCQTAYIRECIELPDGDILIGFLDAESAIRPVPKTDIQYCKLSEIRLEFYEIDQEIEDDDEDDDDDEIFR